MDRKVLGSVILCWALVFNLATSGFCGNGMFMLIRALPPIYGMTGGTEGKVAIAKERGPVQDSCKSLKVDWEDFYRSGLVARGVADFGSENLIALLDGSDSIVKMLCAWLLGYRKEARAIPRLEQLLSDESLPVQRAAARALLQMGNMRGVEVLEDFVNRVALQIQAGDLSNYVEQLDALEIIADAGRISAIPHLRKFKQDKNMGLRLGAMRSLAKLYDKDPLVLEDIIALQKDPDGQVRTEAMQILRRLRPDHPSVSLEVLHGSIYIRDAKKGRATKRTIQIKDKRIDPNQLGSLQIVSIETMEGSKVKLLQTRPVKGGCQIDLEIQDPNVPGAIDIQGDNGQVRGLFVDYLVIRFIDGRELTVPVWFYFRQ